MTTAEADQLIALTPMLDPVFEEAVDLACRTPNIKLYQTHFFSDLEDSKLPETHPKDVLRLLLYTLSKSGDTTLHGYVLQPLYERLEKVLTESEILPLKNILKKLGVL